MHFEIIEKGNFIDYVLVERGEITDKQLEELRVRSFFVIENGRHVKKFLKDQLMFEHDFKAIRERFNKHQEKAFSCGFSVGEFENALEWVSG